MIYPWYGWSLSGVHYLPGFLGQRVGLLLLEFRLDQLLGGLPFGFFVLTLVLVLFLKVGQGLVPEGVETVVVVW